jgi:hydrogenase maturation protease
MPCLLVAGLGNIFLGDNGFGWQSCGDWRGALQAAGRGVDFGSRGLDLAYALLEEYATLMLVDVAARGEPPGTRYLIEPHVDPYAGVTLDGHGMDPAKLLARALALERGPASCGAVRTSRYATPKQAVCLSDT